MKYSRFFQFVLSTDILEKEFATTAEKFFVSSETLSHEYSNGPTVI